MGLILFVYEREMPTVSITKECMGFLNTSGIIENKFCRIHEVTAELVDQADAVYFIRPNDMLSYNLAKKVKASGRLVITLFDDDLLNLPDEIPFAPWRRHSMIQILEITDVLVSSSQHILDSYQKMFSLSRTIRLDTIVREDEFSTVKDDGHSDVRIVYAAGPKHVGLFNQYILPVFPKICDRYGKSISFTFVGLYPELDEYKEKTNISIVNGMPLLEYRMFMQESCFDIGLAPLVSNEFTKCKYFNKFLEYTTANVVGIYSKTEPYTYVVENEVNGFLAENDLDSWYKQLCYVIDHAEVRKQCLVNAVDYVKENHSITRFLDKFLDYIPELKEGVTKKEKIGHIQKHKLGYLIYRLFDYAYLTIFYLRQSGIKGFLKNASIHVKERRNGR